MRKFQMATLAALVANPAHAAEGPFFSLANTDFIVLVSFLLFLGVLAYFKIPGMITGLLDKRAAGIQAELDEARALREEAQTLLASYERKQREVQAQVEKIVAAAKDEAQAAADAAQRDLELAIERRMAAAEGQIASAEAAAIREVRDQAISVAIAAARDLIARDMSASASDQLIDDAIAKVDAKLH